MQFITSVAAKVVQANATTLTTGINDSITTLVFTDQVWTTGTPTITIGAENITLGATADGGTTWTGCTRGANATSNVAHVAGQEALVLGGEELLSSGSFNGTTFFSAIRVSANVQFTAGIDEDGTLKYKPRSSASQMELILPMARYQPANGKVFKVLVWLRYNEATEADFSAEMQS